MRVARLRTTPVKGLALHDVEALELVERGISDDRCFVCTDERLRRLYTGDLGVLAHASATWDEPSHALAVAFPDGTRVEGTVECASETLELVAPSGRTVLAVEVLGAFASELSRVAGRPLRVFRIPVGSDGAAPLTLLGDGSMSRLAGELGLDALDSLRFRMSIELEGLAPHAEDGWQGQRLRLGEVEVVVGGPVPRCVVTTRNPDTLERDHDTLRTLLRYRRPMPTGEAPFGVYATVARPGVVRLGDVATVLA